jgi:N-acetylglucosaminyldiphosphoundecaprenol N-acetyl-beta-D-mannosaminyltransferase
MQSNLDPVAAAGAGAPERLSFLECPFDPVRPEDAIERVVSWCRGPRQPHTIITMNAAVLMMMRSDPALAAAVRNGDLIVADGVPVVWASRLVGTPLPARLAGVDLMLRLLHRASTERLRIFFLGAKEEVVTQLVALCRERFPGAVIAGYRNGYFKEPDYPEVIGQIRDSAADILFIGMPTPFKEIWGEAHRETLGVPAIMGVGGSFDVIAGFIRRAPPWMQELGLEWFWRLLMEPKKMWKRYLVTNTQFVGHVLKHTLRNRMGISLTSLLF